ncbi:MAG TPA: DNA primase [Candidatus Krumholzibacteriaceae bacterium]|nr:DNA primase [Candidatus Krumholzibacteriaceae bacterium]
MIPEEKINEIRDRSDIVDVIGSVLDLKKSGMNFKALCPFHDEKTPSFVVSPDKQIYHCFGCGKGGNVFSFLMDYEGVSFIEAVRKLAAKLGIDIDLYLNKGKSSKRLDPFYSALNYTGKYYKRILLKTESGKNAVEYLKRRGIDNSLMEDFNLGFAPPGWDNLYKRAAKDGLSKDILLKLKLVMRSKGGYRDYFRNRIIYPIYTLTNRTVGFAGRVLDKSEPKYLNTSESPVYSKGKILYGLNKSKKFIRKSKTALLVEGYMDLLMLWKAGFRNVCAVCGTSFTKEQARLLARYAKRVYIINDGDRAGMLAAVRSADQLLIEGLTIKIVVLPQGEDPDSYVNKNGAGAFRSLLNSADDYFVYLSKISRKGKEQRARKSRIIKHLIDTVSHVRDRVDRNLYLQEISDIFDIPIDDLRAGFKPGKRRKKKRETKDSFDDKVAQNQKLLFSIGSKRECFAKRILDNLLEDDLKREIFRKYYRCFQKAVKDGVELNSAEFFGKIKDPELSDLAAQIAFIQPPPGPAEKLLDDTLLWLKRRALRREMVMMKERLDELHSISGAGNSAEEIEIAEAYRKIARELGKLGLQGG